MKPQMTADRMAADDGLIINQATRHQYYNTVQSDVHPQGEIDNILDRRRIQSLVERHNQTQRNQWLLAALAVATLAGLVWALV